MKKLFVFAFLLTAARINAQNPPPGGDDHLPEDPVDRFYECTECGTGEINLCTGFNHSAGVEYGHYRRDAYWTVTHIADPAPNGTPVDYCAWVIPPAPIWQAEVNPYVGTIDPDPSWQSQWISTHPSHYYVAPNMNSNCTSKSGGPIMFSRKFEICAGPTVTVYIDMAFLSDGMLGELYIDGQSQGTITNAQCGGNYDQNLHQPAFFQKAVTLANGVHTLSFELYNNDGNYMGVNVQGRIYTDGNNKLTDVECYGVAACEELDFPLCPAEMGDIVAITANGRQNNNCLFTCEGDDDFFWSQWTVSGYTWYYENVAASYPVLQPNGNSFFNIVVPNGKTRAVTARIVYTNDKGKQCASYHSELVGCSYLVPNPDRRGNHVTGINSEELQREVTIYPNPGSDEFHFTKEVDLIIVSDLMGREIARETDAKMIRSHSWSKGTYLVKMQDAGETSYQRIIKE